MLVDSSKNLFFSHFLSTYPCDFSQVNHYLGNTAKELKQHHSAPQKTTFFCKKEGQTFSVLHKRIGVSTSLRWKTCGTHKTWRCTWITSYTASTFSYQKNTVHILSQPPCLSKYWRLDHVYAMQYTNELQILPTVLAEKR